MEAQKSRAQQRRDKKKAKIGKPELFGAMPQSMKSSTPAAPTDTKKKKKKRPFDGSAENAPQRASSNDSAKLSLPPREMIRGAGDAMRVVDATKVKIPHCEQLIYHEVSHIAVETI